MKPVTDDPTQTPTFPIDQQERLFHGFLEAAPDAVVIIDGNGAIAKVNSQAEKMFGYGRRELIGRPVEMLMPKRYRVSHAADARRYSANPATRPMGRGLGLFGLRQDGSEFPIDVSISPLPPERGVLIASIIRDMSSQRRLEEDLRERTRELEEADRQKDDYLSAVAHELRTPLGVLSLAAQVLRRPEASGIVHEQTLDKIERQTAHMTRLIEDLLDLTRIRCGTVTLRQEVVDLRTVLANAVEIAQPLIESRRHRLEIGPIAAPLSVSGDPTRLVQVVSNLITNAAKYTPEGGHIWCSAANEGGTATIRIRDNGIGIPKEMLASVFGLFTRAVSTRDDSTGGLGIGLALVRRLVELHGGTVEAASDGLGMGTELIVRLPLLSAGPEATEVATTR